MKTMQISTVQLEKDAAKLGLTFETMTVNGNVHITGRTGDVIKAFAAQGADVVKDGEHSWKVLLSGEYAGLILAGDGRQAPTTWALGRTPCMM